VAAGSRSYPSALTWTRLFYMYETGQNPKSIYGQLAAAVDRDDHFDVSTGEQTRDYLPIEAIADRLVRLSLLGRDWASLTSVRVSRGRCEASSKAGCVATAGGSHCARASILIRTTSPSLFRAAPKNCARFSTTRPFKLQRKLSNAAKNPRRQPACLRWRHEPTAGDY
jgi:hypothetical protein